MPDTQLPTADEAFSNLSPEDKQTNSLPTADEAFGNTNPEPKTYSGPVADHFFSTGTLGKIAKSVLTAVPREVLSIADEWNQGPDSLKEFDKLPKIQEFFKGQSDWSKAVNEAWMRPGIYALDTAQRAWNVLGAEVVKPVEGLADISGYTSQQFQDLRRGTQNPLLKSVYGEQQFAYGVGAEMLSGVAEGWLEFGHFPHPGSPLDTVVKSKSEGMIGDSGPGPDGKLPPETEAARNLATGQIVPVPQDIHGAARNLSPETFSDYDNLRAHQQVLRRTLQGLQESQTENPRFTELNTQIETILSKVNGIEERLTDKAADRLDSLRDELRDTPKKVDSEDMAQLRHDLQVTDYKLRDLAPDVSAVYHETAKRHGYDLYDSRPNGNPFSEPLKEPETAAQGVPGTEVPQTKEATSEPSKAQSQHIFDDTVARLTAAGRPLEEAQAAGKLLQSHYEARAARFKGKLGTAEELYKKEAPDVVSFNRRTKGKNEPKEVTLNQYIGEKAYGSDIVHKAKLSVAKQLESEGKNPEEIKAATGWFKSPFDGKWRTEISDHGADLKPSFNSLEGTARLEDILHHPELFDAYPELKDVKVTRKSAFLDMWQSTQGWLATDGTLNVTPYAKEPLSVLLHEIQHKIQRHEGFATGGSASNIIGKIPAEKLPELFKQTIEETQKRLTELSASISKLRQVIDSQSKLKNLFKENSLGDLLSRYTKANQASDALYEKYNNLSKDLSYEERKPVTDAWLKSREELRQLEEKVRETLFGVKGYLELPDEVRSADINIFQAARDGNFSRLHDTVARQEREFVKSQGLLTQIQAGDKEALQKALPEDKAFTFYRNIAGEIEARDTQARQGMTPEERAATAPYSSEEINPDDALVSFGDEPAKADEPPKPANDESGKQELEPFHKRFVENVKQRVEEARKRGEEYHANGKLPFEVGTRFKTPKSTETNQGPWEVAGYFVDSKNPDRYGYYVKRGTKDIDLESTVMLVNDSKRPEVAEYAKNYQLFTDLKILEQGRRGSLTLREGRKNLLKLFSKADASTFFHESGHQWLEELIQDSQHPEAPEDLKTDAQVIRDWLGNKGETLSTKQHEQFARGFETYLMEGRAPTKELASIFAKFKQWLTKIYETVKSLNSPISDEVRGVMDRLVAEPNKDARETVIAPEPKEPEARTNLDVINDTNLKASQAPPSFDTETELGQNELKYVDKAGNVRLDTLNLDSDVVDTIKDLVTTHEQARGWAKTQGKVTPQDAVDYSDTSGLAPSEVSLQKLEEVFSDKGISVSSAIKAAREMYASVGQQIYDIAVKGEGSELDYISAIQKFARIDQVLQKASPESGRILKAWDKKAAEAAEKVQGLNEYLQGAIGKDLATIRKEMKAWELSKTAEQRAKIARNSLKASLGQMMVEWVQNAWISGPFTHAYYIADIGLRTVEKNLLEAPVSAAIGSIHSIFSKDVDRVSWGEVGDKLYGLFDGGRKGILAAARATKLGVPQGLRLLDLAREKADYEVSQGTITEAQRDARVKELTDNPTKDMEYKNTPSQPFIDQYKKIPGKLGSVIRTPGERLVNPLHTIGYSVNFATNLSGAISRTARLEGAAKGWTKDQVKQRMAELHYNTPTELIQEARDNALDVSLMNKSGPYTGKLSAVLGHEFNIPGLGKTPVGQIVNPFIGMVSKAINKAVKGIAFTNPVTPFLYKDVRDTFLGDDASAKHDAIAKMVIGATVFSTVWGLLDQGMMNGPAPDKAEEAVVSKMVYGMPNSFRVGDMSYGLDHLGAVGLRLALIGDIHQFKGDVQTEEFSTALGKLFNNLQHDILSTKAIAGVSDFLDAIEHHERFGQRYVNNFLVSGGTPFSTALNQTSARIDPYARRVSADGKTGLEGELQLLLEQEKSIIPKWRETLQPKVDLLGNDVPSENHWGLYATQMSSDPVYQMLVQNKYFPAPVQPSIKIGGNTVQLNDEQYHEYAKKSGAGAKVLLDFYLNQPGWNDMPDQVKHKLIQTAFSQARKEAIQSILPQPQYLDLLNKSLSMNQDFVNGVQ